MDWRVIKKKKQLVEGHGVAGHEEKKHWWKDMDWRVI